MEPSRSMAILSEFVSSDSAAVVIDPTFPPSIITAGDDRVSMPNMSEVVNPTANLEPYVDPDNLKKLSLY